MKRKIVWASQHLEIDTITGRFKDVSQPEKYLEYEGEADDQDELQGQLIQNVISTPFGIWRVNDTMNPYKQFKMWMAHTNFNLSAKVAKKIKKIPGVEVLNVLTRYRFIIGVGELFNIRDVRTDIERSFECNKEKAAKIGDQSIKDKINTLKKKLKQHDNWAIYIFPNGQIDFATDDNGLAQFNEKLTVYKHAVDHSTEILIEKDNE